MILGRPANLALSAFTGLFNVVVLITQSANVTFFTVALVAAINLAAAAIIAFVANQPPTLNPGDTFNVTTPAGQPNATTTVATPPAADKPPVPNPPAK